MKEYSLAVIIPCWNCESFIKETLDCLLKQTFSDWKAFIVDDGCADGTAVIVKEYSERDARLNYVLRSRDPKGAQACRNIGFDLSEGAKYVVFFDADDVIAPYCFKQRVQFMDEHPLLDFAVFPAKAFKQKVLDETNLVYGMRFIENDLQAMLNWNLPMVVWNNIYRRQALVDFDLRWDEKLLSLQDSDFNIQAMVKGMHYDYANADFDYFYRKVDDGIAKKIRTKQHYDSHLYLLEKTLNSVALFSPDYDFYLRNHVLLFMNMMREYPSYLKSISQLSWVRKDLLFHLKIMLLVLLKFKGKTRLFKKEIHYSMQMTSMWVEFMKTKAESLRMGGVDGIYSN